MLVATDVAARGIHVDNVALVMHYDPAGSDKDYIHRSGRTGRAGQDGRVISMVVEDKKKIARQLQKDLGLRPGFDDLEIAEFPEAVERPKLEPEHFDGPRRGGESRGGRKPQDNRGPGRRKPRSKSDSRSGDRPGGATPGPAKPKAKKIPIS